MSEFFWFLRIVSQALQRCEGVPSFLCIRNQRDDHFFDTERTNENLRTAALVPRVTSVCMRILTSGTICFHFFVPAINTFSSVFHFLDVYFEVPFSCTWYPACCFALQSCTGDSSDGTSTPNIEKLLFPYKTQRRHQKTFDFDICYTFWMSYFCVSMYQEIMKGWILLFVMTYTFTWINRQER